MALSNLESLSRALIIHSTITTNFTTSSAWCLLKKPSSNLLFQALESFPHRVHHFIMSWKSVTMCGSWGWPVGVMDWKEIGLTRTTKTRHEYLNMFVKRRGAWASPNQPLVKRRTNACEEGLHTGTQGNGLHTRETEFRMPLWKERCMGKPKHSLVMRHVNTQTSKFYTWETQFRTSLLKERCMGKPERFLATSRTNTQARFTLTRKTRFRTLCERRGAWASPNAPLPLVAWTHKQDLH